MRKLGWLISSGGLCVALAAGCSTSSPNNTAVGTWSNDAAITAKVKSDFVSDPAVSAMHLGVTTNNGVVELTGKASSEEEERRAVQIARSVRGVKSVRDYIVVQPAMPQ
jgi:hyperosmotically inducible protein